MFFGGLGGGGTSIPPDGAVGTRLTAELGVIPISGRILLLLLPLGPDPDPGTSGGTADGEVEAITAAGTIAGAGAGATVTAGVVMKSRIKSSTFAAKSPTPLDDEVAPPSPAALIQKW